MTALGDATIEKLWAGTLPAPHTGFPNALDAVLDSRL
jgi:hypothetical protein